ncbi:hypothetical protein D3C85_1904230 [compost metagenome]
MQTAMHCFSRKVRQVGPHGLDALVALAKAVGLDVLAREDAPVDPGDRDSVRVGQALIQLRFSLPFRFVGRWVLRP